MKKIIHRWKSALALLTAVCLLGAGLVLPAAADSPYKLPDDLTVASPAALVLASNEVITEFMVVFGVVPANFRQVEAPQVYCNVVSWLTGGTQFVNQADVGGVYNGQWIMATSRWVTKVYKPAEPLPRTGY